MEKQESEKSTQTGVVNKMGKRITPNLIQIETLPQLEGISTRLQLMDELYSRLTSTAA
jgi:hypothetical protein